MKINASECNVEVEEYRNERVETQDEYTGIREITVDNTIIGISLQELEKAPKLLFAVIQNRLII